MALPVQRSVAGLVDIGAYHAVQIPPADDESQRDAALVDAFRVVGGPRDGICDAGIYPKGTKEGAAVADSWRCSKKCFVNLLSSIW